MKPVRETAGQRIAALRAKRKLTLRELSKLTGIDHAYIHMIEHGKKVPSEALLGKLLKALGERRAVTIKTVLCFGGEELEMKP